jgi:tetratricopeptide (TPR) repeat protein
LICAAFAVCWAYERAVEDARRPLAAAGAGLVLLTLFIHLPVPISQPKAVAKIEEAKARVSSKKEIQAKEAPVEESSVAEGYRVHLRRAGQYSSQGKLEKAAQEFERAAALAPAATALDIRIRLALSLEEGGRYSEAKRRWEEVAALGPPPGIAELARRHLIRIKRKLRTEPPPAAEQKGSGQWERDTE